MARTRLTELSGCWALRHWCRVRGAPGCEEIGTKEELESLQEGRHDEGINRVGNGRYCPGLRSRRAVGTSLVANQPRPARHGEGHRDGVCLGKHASHNH